MFWDVLGAFRGRFASLVPKRARDAMAGSCFTQLPWDIWWHSCNCTAPDASPASRQHLKVLFHACLGGVHVISSDFRSPKGACQRFWRGISRAKALREWRSVRKIFDRSPRAQTSRHLVTSIVIDDQRLSVNIPM